MRTAEINRTTAETAITLRLCLDGTGASQVQSGVGFLDHMLTLFAKHSRFDLTLTCSGDTKVDDHHSVEDIGIVLDESCLPETLTAREVGKLMALTYERWEPETFSGYLTRFSIPLDKANKDFSRGMKMKLALAVALSHRAKLLLLDEATSGLDPMVREEVLDILLDFTREEDHTVVLSSHIVSDLEKVCDYIAFLHQGKLLLFEEKDRLLEEYALVRLPAAQLQELDPAAIAGQRVGPYGAEALVRREKIPAGFVMEHTSLEDIILFLARKGGEPG